jgi:class 3 adenylate cyclase
MYTIEQSFPLSPFQKETNCVIIDELSRRVVVTSKPSGTVTFLFKDIENSTQRAREHPDFWEAAQRRHDAILCEAIELHYGFVFELVGDTFCADLSLRLVRSDTISS